MLLNDGIGEDSWESLDCKEIQPVHPKEKHSSIFCGGTDVEAEPPILWPPDVKSWLIRKDIDAGKDWRQEKKGTTEDETVGWHHWHNGHEFEQTLRDSEGQGGLVCCSPWGRKRVRHKWGTEKQQSQRATGDSQKLSQFRREDTKIPQRFLGRNSLLWRYAVVFSLFVPQFRGQIPQKDRWIKSWERRAWFSCSPCGCFGQD